MQRLLHKGFLVTGYGLSSIHVRHEMQFCAFASLRLCFFASFLFASLRLCVRFFWIFLLVARAPWIARSARFAERNVQRMPDAFSHGPGLS